MHNNLTRELILNHRKGFVLTEILAVVTILALMVGLASMNLFGVFTRASFKSQVQDFVSTMQMACRSAAANGKRYEVVVDIGTQSYLLREIKSDELFDVIDDEVIEERNFGSECRIQYVQFDDGMGTDAEHQEAKFRVGPFGWQFGGKIVFLDSDGNSHTVLVNRISRFIELREGDVELLMPKKESEL